MRRPSRSLSASPVTRLAWRCSTTAAAMIASAAKSNVVSSSARNFSDSDSDLIKNAHAATAPASSASKANRRLRWRSAPRRAATPMAMRPAALSAT